MTEPNRALLALSAILGGAAAGAAVGTIGAWVGNWTARSGVTALANPSNVVFLGNGLGVFLGLFLGWHLSAGLEETWRRAAIGVTAAFGALAGGMASIFSLMLSSRMAQLMVPGYLVLLVAVCYASVRLSRRQRQVAATLPPV